MSAGRAEHRPRAERVLVVTAFRARHGASSYGRLDRPPAAIVTAAVPVRIYDLARRARFLRGERDSTAHVLDTRR